MNAVRIAIRAVVIVLSTTSAANAGTIVCGGTVDTIAYHNADTFMVKLSSMNAPVFFCSMESVWSATPPYSMGPQTCKALFAMFLSAKLSGTPVNDVYFESNDAPTACNDWGWWKSANIRYFTY